MKIYNKKECEVLKEYSKKIFASEGKASLMPLSIQSQSLNERNLNNIIKPEELDADFLSKIIYFQDALLTSRGFLIDGESVIFDSQFVPSDSFDGFISLKNIKSINSNGFDEYDHTRNIIKYTRPIRERLINEPVFVFNSNVGWSNFGHFFHDMLLQVPTYLRARKYIYNLRPAFVNNFSYPIMQKILRALIGDDLYDQRIILGPLQKLKEAYVPRKHFELMLMYVFLPALRQLKKLIEGKITNKYKAIKGKNIILSRKDSKKEEMFGSNFDDVIKILAAIGFEQIQATDLDIEDYMGIFCNIGILIGEHGAGLFNCALSQEAKLIELSIPRIRSYNSVPIFMSHLTDEYIRVDASQIGNTQYKWDFDLIADIVSAFRKNETIL
uniref:Glycosyltransferase 61 catalytic domain-containing protein n=1 Tax=Candidatus Kentrum sp. DK TaxID=2126562 RepID=A0A450SWZ6_9GAMM|nr:MAG: Protein of unknown function (DUF563) [Candidatus Kentron sp. DK]